jgi:microcin C transport system substrate-binding protein
MQRRDLLALGATLASLPIGARAANPAGGGRPGEVVRTHAMALLGEPALPADFTHWPWVNPNAPKGGEITLTAIGSFDSFNPFILRGTAAVGSTLIYDTMLARNLDEPLS